MAYELAARVEDEIHHSSALFGLVSGLIVGAAIGALCVLGAIATVFTGGLALGPILAITGAVATGASIGAGVGQLVGSLKTSKEGTISTSGGAIKVQIEFKRAARVTDIVICKKHSEAPAIADGSGNVYIESLPASRKNDALTCGGMIGSAASKVWIGGGTVRYLLVTDEVPRWLSWLVIGLGFLGPGAFMWKAGWTFARIACTLVGGYLGGRWGGAIGGRWGRGGAIVGSIIGGALLGGIGNRIGTVLSRYRIHTEGLGANLGNVRITRDYPNPISGKSWGHTFTTHGSKRPVSQLLDRARSTGTPQGQWLDNELAAQTIWKSRSSNPSGPQTVPIPPNTGQVHLPNGTTQPATHAVIVYRPDGSVRTAYPILSGGP